MINEYSGYNFVYSDGWNQDKFFRLRKKKKTHWKDWDSESNRAKNFFQIS